MAEDDATGGAAQQPGQQGQEKQQLAIRKIYLRDLSFEVPDAPAIFTGEWSPETTVDLDTRSREISEGVYETILRVTVTAKQGDKTAYLCEVEQGGVFIISGFEGQTLDMLLGSYCPAQLFPFVREAISDVVAKGGFPQMVLAPVNFEALYMQRRRRMQERQEQDQAQGDAGNADSAAGAYYGPADR